VDASANPTPCLRRFAESFLGSHSNAVPSTATQSIGSAVVVQSSGALDTAVDAVRKQAVGADDGQGAKNRTINYRRARKRNQKRRWVDVEAGSASRFAGVGRRLAP
jgi:hypothetical protein